MPVLNHLAQAAAVLLLFELIVLVLIFAALGGGIAFGLHWLRGKARPTMETTLSLIGRFRRYLRVGSDYAAKPFISLEGALTAVGAGADSLRRRVRATRISSPALPAEATFLTPLLPAEVPAWHSAELTAGAPVETSAGGHADKT